MLFVMLCASFIVTSSLNVSWQDGDSQSFRTPFPLNNFSRTGKTSNPNSPKAYKATKKASKHSASCKDNGGGGGINSAQEGILQTLAKLRAIGIHQPKRDMVQGLSGNSKTKAGYVKNLGIMKKKSYIEYTDGQTISLTDAGVRYVGDDVDPASLSNESFHADIKKMIAPKTGKILDVLADGKVHDRNKVARALGYDMNKLSGYTKSLSQLSSLGFLTYDKTTLQLTDKAFPLGRPGVTKKW